MTRAQDRHPVTLSCKDYVCSREGSRAEDYDPSIAAASHWTAGPLTKEMFRRAKARRVDVSRVLRDYLTKPGSGNELLDITREIMRERYDAELSKRTHAKA